MAAEEERDRKRELASDIWGLRGEGEGGRGKYQGSNCDKEIRSCLDI